MKKKHKNNNKNNETKSQLFKKFNKLDKPLARIIMMKSYKTQIINIRNAIFTDPAGI